MPAPTWEQIAGVLSPYLLPRSEAARDWFNPLAYGAAWDGVTDDTAAIQACLNAAMAAADAGSNGRISTVFFPSGQARANGLLVSKSNVRIFAPGCTLRSFANPATPQHILSFVGDGFDEGELISHNSIVGLTIHGGDHANAGGLRLQGCAHFSCYEPRFRSCVGPGGALQLINSYDIRFWGGFTDWCGVAGSGATLLDKMNSSTAATQILFTAVESCNQVFFYGHTWESNNGLDIIFDGPDGGFNNNAISFVGCKWEQSSGNTVYAGVYAKKPVTNCLTFEGKGYTAGLYRDGCWLWAQLATSSKLVISPSHEFGYKSDQMHGANTQPSIILSGTGSALIGGRLTSLRALYVPFVDIQAVQDPVAIEFGDVSVGIDQKAGWRLIGAGGLAARCDVDQGKLRYVFSLAGSDSGTAPNEAALFVPRGKSGIMNVTVWDTPTACGQAGFRAARVSGDPEGTVSASVAAIGAPAALEFGTGVLTTGDTSTTAGKIHVRLDTLGRVHVQNRMAGTRRVFVSFEPARTF